MRKLKWNATPIRKNVGLIKRLLPFLALIAPIVLLYALYPKSFEGDPTWEGTWQGRFFYIFFLWLLLLETILSWDTLEKNKITRIGSKRTVALIMVSALPMIYIIAANFLGANAIIVDLAKQQSIHFSNLIPLVVEYFIFAVLFNVIILLMYGKQGIKNFSISAFFLIIIGMLYTIDDVYPYGRFTPFQLIVPTTTNLAAQTLNLMGYSTIMEQITSPFWGSMPKLTAWDPRMPSQTYTSFSIAWPCAGVESLIIYTVTILLFLKRSSIPGWSKILYFVIGAVVTYFINVLRIVSIFVVAMNDGNWMQFHNIYGPLYSISWIISYPLIIVGSQLLWSRIKTRRERTKNRVEPLLSQCSLDSLG
jgi:thaumarchaeosortase